MSSLCCAIATPDRSLPCHRCATLGISSLFHANASEAKPCRSESLRCTTFPSQITSALFSAIPSPRIASPCLCFSVPFHALLSPSMLCLCFAYLCFSVPLHSSSPHSLCFAPPCLAFAKPRFAKPSHGQSNSSLPLLGLSAASGALPLLGVSSLCNASANPGCQCHALALRLSPHRRCR